VGARGGAGFERPHGDVEDARVLARIDGQAMLVVAHRERSRRCLEFEHELARRELEAVVVAQHRQQHAVGEVLRGGLPVDVEELREGRRRSVLEDVLPPRVVRGEHAHVVRDDVHQLGDAVLAQLGHERLEIRARADLGIQLVVVDDVVAVLAAGRALRYGEQ
jgi:hypothetical protein